MKLFGYKLQKEKRSKIPEYVNSWSDALTFSTLLNNEQSRNISAVYRAVELISDSIAIIPIQVKQRNGMHSNVIENHPVTFAIECGLMTRYNFIKKLIESVLLNGNGFAWIGREKGVVTKLVYLKPSEVTINYNESTGELSYTASKVSKTKILPCDMIHLVKNSDDGVNGQGVIKYASRTLNISHATENSCKNYFENGCNLAGVLTVQGQLSEQQRKDIRTSWNQAYSNGGLGLAILQGNMSYQNIQPNAADSQMLESRLYNIQDIARFFGISPVLLGDLSHSSFSTLEATQQQFLLQTLQPYVVMIEQEFTRKLLPQSDLFINLDETAILKTDKSATATYYNTLLSNGVLCINEVRQELGYSQIDGGDKHIIPFTDIEQNTIVNETEQGTKKI